MHEDKQMHKCDNLDIAHIPQRVVDKMAELTHGAFPHSVTHIDSRRTAHTWRADTIERAWIFPEGLLATGCSDHSAWFAWVNGDLHKDL